MMIGTIVPLAARGVGSFVMPLVMASVAAAALSGVLGLRSCAKGIAAQDELADVVELARGNIESCAALGDANDQAMRALQVAEADARGKASAGEDLRRRLEQAKVRADDAAAKVAGAEAVVETATAEVVVAKAKAEALAARMKEAKVCGIGDYVKLPSS